jgi:hypothetical protein
MAVTWGIRVTDGMTVRLLKHPRAMIMQWRLAC